MRRLRNVGVVLLALLSGCASQTRIEDQLPRRMVRQIELRETPFFPQKDYECGPAALATVLVASGVAVTAQELTPKVYLPERRGSLQVELIAAARGYDRLPYSMAPRFDLLLAEVAAGRPVLVLQN